MEGFWLRALVSLALVLTGCSAPVVPQGTSAVAPPQFSIDRQRALTALGDRPNSMWQDQLFNKPAVQARHKLSRYRVSTATAGASWPAPANLPSASTNGTAYVHLDTSFGNQSPHAGELVVAVCDDAAGTVVRMDAANNGAIVSPNFTALAGLAGAGTITKSAVGMSGNNKRMYFLTTGGYLVILDALAGTRLAAVKLSSAGFTGIAPFVDYANGGGFDFNDEHLFALATDGSLYQVRVTPTGLYVKGWRVSGGTDSGAMGTSLGATSGTLAVSSTSIVALNFGGTLAVKASPLCWNDSVIFGAGNGKLYRVRTAANAVDSIQLSSWGIETTPAFEFDMGGWGNNINDIFIPAGDRLHWVDASSPTGLTRKAISPPLVLDKKPASGASGASGKLSAYSYASAVTPFSYTANDWVAAATAATAAGQGPTRWGNGALDMGAVNTTGNPYDVVLDPITSHLWITTPADNHIREYDPATSTFPNVYDGNGNYAALVKTIPVGAGGRPAGLADDPYLGGVWVSCYGSSCIKLLDAAGNPTPLGTITGVPNPTALAYEKDVTPGVDVLWVCCTTGPTTGPATGKLAKIVVRTGGGPIFNGAQTYYDNTNTAAAAKNYDTFTAPNPKVTALTSAAWTFQGPQGVTVDANGMVWVSNSCENTDLTQCNFAAASYPFNIDGHGTGTGRGSVLIFNPATSKFDSRLITTGQPYNAAPYHDAVTNKDTMWLATYRWGVDTTERYDIGTLARTFVSNQTGNHWQPHWVAVDAPNNQVWIVNGDADTAFSGTAADGADRIKATSTGTGPMSAANANWLGTSSTGAQPRGVSLDSTGNCWIANASAKTCTKYSKTAAALGTYPVGTNPLAVQCDKFDVAWVCNLLDDTVSRLTPTTLPPAPLVTPHGVGIDANDNLWIANSGDNTLTVLDQTGNTTQLKLPTNSQPNGVCGGQQGLGGLRRLGHAPAVQFHHGRGHRPARSPQ